jgi:hypothetical protein
MLPVLALALIEPDSTVESRPTCTWGGAVCFAALRDLAHSLIVRSDAGWRWRRLGSQAAMTALCTDRCGGGPVRLPVSPVITGCTTPPMPSNSS